MATKKKGAKKKKAAAPKPAAKLTYKLSAAHKSKAAACIAKNGKVTFSIKPISVTKVPATLSGIVIVD